MSKVLKLTRDDPIIHLKAYGGVQIHGVEDAEMRCEIDSSELATLVEENGHVYVTINTGCSLTVPSKSTLEIEKGMGSIKINNILNDIRIEKVLGNLVLLDVTKVSVGKVGGNCSVKNAKGSVVCEKVAGSLVVDDVESFSCEKIGGFVKARSIAHDFNVDKVGGGIQAQDLIGRAKIMKVGGSIKGNGIHLAEDLKVGGDIELFNASFDSGIDLKAGGDILLGLSDLSDLTLDLYSGSEKIMIRKAGEIIGVGESTYTYKSGDETSLRVDLYAGGNILVTDEMSEPVLIGDLSDNFKFEETAFGEMIRERVESATRLAEAKVRATEIRLGKLHEKLENEFGFKLDIDLGKDVPDVPTPPSVHAPIPVSRPAGKKGATDEERLMILKMLQDKQISVEEAENLFKVLES